MTVNIIKKSLNIKTISFIGNAFDHDRVQHLITNHREKIKDLISEQTTEWSELVLRQLTEEHLIKIEQV